MKTNGSDTTSLSLLCEGEDVTLDEDAGLPLLKAATVTSNLAGTRLLFGSSDGELRCVDFFKWVSGGSGPLWTKNLNQGINGVAVSGDDSYVAVACGNVLSFYTDAGDHIVNSTKGDMYLMDARKTRGHTATVTCVVPDPQNFNLFTSGSIDGTIRTFDVESQRQGVAMSIHSSHAYVPKAARGPRAPIYSLCMASIKGSLYVVGGTEKGGLLTWDKRTANPAACCLDAYLSRVSCVLSPDDNVLVSRADDSIKLWDMRNFKKEVKHCNVPGGDVSGNMALSPDGLHVAAAEVTPINPRNIKEGFKGCIRVLKTGTLETVETFKTKAAPGSLCWSYEVPQLFSACYDGRTWARCSPDALEAMHLSNARAAYRKKLDTADHTTVSVQPQAYAIDFLPDNLEEADDGTLRRKRVQKQYKKPGAREEPDLDFVSYGRTPVHDEEEDIVKRLRTMDGSADVTAAASATGIQRIPYKADKYMGAYKKTQPDLILDFTAPKTKEENMLQSISRCPRCGTKICRCGYMDSLK
ncbi:gastrulation defective protein 1-related protein [Babesia gibsoni]|uniref:Gastrulation defective protein 1-related protein n=1 Tax=Babesia gibsoni TaxID=33632 RepID=A0AAD8PDE1_BABGI|nr:gastrulation defective protein 1-related protein [Babesia gibsoni]